MRYPTPEEASYQRDGTIISQSRPNWWLRLTSFGWATPQRTIEQRERARRSRLASWITLGLLICDLVLLPAGLGDLPTLAAITLFFFSLLIALVLNRAGFVSVAGVLLVLVLCSAVLGSVTFQGSGLELLNLPAYDLLAVAVVVAATVLPRLAAFGIAGLNIALICLDYFLQRHAADLAQAEGLYGALGLLARPIALQLLVAVVAYLWVRGTDEAIRRADRAEEIATLEHTLADQKRQLDVGIQQLLQTHVRAANGDFSARAPLGQDNILWQIASSLNNLLSRLQRSGMAEHQLRRTEEELHRLAAAIDDAQAGRPPLWPAPTGTAADLIIERIARGQRRRSVPTASRDQIQPSGFGQGQVDPSGPLGPFGQMPMPAPQGWPAPQAWPGQNSAPFGQPPQAPDQWQQRPAALPEGNPWAFPQDPGEDQTTTG